MSSLDLDSLLSKKSLGLGPGVSGPHTHTPRTLRFIGIPGRAWNAGD